MPPPAEFQQPDADRLTNTLESVQKIIELNTVQTMIPSYSGDPRQFQTWIKNIKKYSLACNLNDHQKKHITFQTSRGPVSDYIQRRMQSTASKDEDWNSFRANLASRFAEISDWQHAFHILRCAKQEPHESCIIFSERLISLADDSFLGQPISSEMVENHLIQIFIEGLREDSLKIKLMRANPRSLQEAIDIALAEENLKKRFNLRRNPNHFHNYYNDEESMEIDHARPIRRCRKCNTFHSKFSACNDGKILSVDSNIFKNKHDQREPITCWHCNKTGHIKRNCFLLQNSQNNPKQQQPHRQHNYQQSLQKQIYQNNPRKPLLGPQPQKTNHYQHHQNYPYKQPYKQNNNNHLNQ